MSSRHATSHSSGLVLSGRRCWDCGVLAEALRASRRIRRFLQGSTTCLLPLPRSVLRVLRRSISMVGQRTTRLSSPGCPRRRCSSAIRTEISWSTSRCSPRNHGLNTGSCRGECGNNWSVHHHRRRIPAHVHDERRWGRGGCRCEPRQTRETAYCDGLLDELACLSTTRDGSLKSVTIRNLCAGNRPAAAPGRASTFRGPTVWTIP